MIDKTIKDMIYGERTELTEIPVNKYVCSECGTVFCSPGGNMIDSCVLCGCTTFTKEDHIESRALSMIPFVKTEEEVWKDYRKRVRFNPLIPRAFKKKSLEKSIHKVYLPTYLVDVNQKGRVLFLAGDKDKVIQGGRKVTNIKKYECYYILNVDYKNILMNISTKIDSKIFTNICDYNFDTIEPVEISKIRDTSYLLDDVKATQTGEVERRRIARYSFLKIRNLIKHQLKKIKKDETSIVFSNAKQVLVPVYLINISYRNKNHQYIMNGQDGKSYISLPIGFLSTLFYILMVAVVLSFILYLVVYYFY